MDKNEIAKSKVNIYLLEAQQMIKNGIIKSQTPELPRDMWAILVIGIAQMLQNEDLHERKLDI